MFACGVSSKFITTHEPSIVVANYVKVSWPKVKVRIYVPQKGTMYPIFPGKIKEKVKR
jgi:hypothetical protein